MVTPDGDWDTQTNDAGQHRWVWHSGGGAEYVGPSWYKTRAAALRAGRKWLAEWRSR
jgi:hypothetical protein